MTASARVWFGVAVLFLLFAVPASAVATPSESLAAGIEGLIADAGKSPDAERLHRLFQLHTDYVM
jgi:hypothetical protein